MSFRTVRLVVLFAAIVTRPGLLRFFRGQPESDARQEAFDTLFEIVRVSLETAAELKPEWTRQWQARTERSLPPKYQPDRFNHPGAVEAAYDARFGSALLQRNRWSSKIQPLFETFDRNAWSRVRATVERASPALLTVRDRYRDSLRLDELSWIDRAVEQLDEARRLVRRAESGEMPESEIVAQTTFRLVYVTVQLSETLLERLREDAEEED